MIAVDTNILARFILRDDPVQTPQADARLATPAWVTATVWLELGWVLDRQLRLQRRSVADALDAILALETIHTAKRDGLRWAVDRYRAGADWADMLHLVMAADNADGFATFDGKLGRQAGSATPLAVKTLA